MAQYILTISTCPRTKAWDYTTENRNTEFLTPLTPCTWEETYDYREDGDGRDLWKFELIIFNSIKERAKFLESYRLQHGAPVFA